MRGEYRRFTMEAGRPITFFSYACRRRVVSSVAFLSFSFLRHESVNRYADSKLEFGRLIRILHPEYALFSSHHLSHACIILSWRAGSSHDKLENAPLPLTFTMVRALSQSIVDCKMESVENALTSSSDTVLLQRIKIRSRPRSSRRETTCILRRRRAFRFNSCFHNAGQLLSSPNDFSHA
jgi:hypothetical protein